MGMSITTNRGNFFVLLEHDLLNDTIPIDFRFKLIFRANIGNRFYNTVLGRR